MSNNPGYKKIPALDLATINKRLNEIWGGIAEGGTPSPIFKRKTILTDAQIKALPTTPVEIIPSMGIGKIILLDRVILVFKIINGYTNVADYNNGILGFDISGGVLALPTQRMIATGLAGNFSITIPRKTESYKVEDLEVSAGVNTAAGTTKPLFISEMDYANRAINITGWNYTLVNNSWGEDLGNFTGGDPENVLEVTSFYSIIDL